MSESYMTEILIEIDDWQLKKAATYTPFPFYYVVHNHKEGQGIGKSCIISLYGTGGRWVCECNERTPDNLIALFMLTKP